MWKKVFGGHILAWNTDLEVDSPAYRFASNTSGVIRGVAGPGTGKSFGLQRRVARLLEEGEDPKRIFAVTFTRTAASDLQKEIQSVGMDGTEHVKAKTLHSFCFGLLNKHDIITRTGRYPRPILEYEQKPMLYDLDVGGNIKSKRNTLKAFESAWARLQSEDPGYPHNEADGLFERAIKKWLQEHKAMLFGEMVIETYRYLRDNPQCFERNEFLHVLVDEYQDLNKAEQKVIDLLATGSNLAIIGDDDQSIYSFKHAYPEGIREFPNTHLNCACIDFDVCRRCPKQVVSMASKLIEHNNNRTLGDLQPFSDNQQGSVSIIQWKSLEDEIEGISHIIADDIINENIQPEDILILTPVRKIGYRVRDALVKRSINAKSYFRETALKNDDLKYSFSLLNLMAIPNDRIALRFLLGFKDPKFRFKSYNNLMKYANDNNETVLNILKKLVNNDLKLPNMTAMKNVFCKVKV